MSERIFPVCLGFDLDAETLWTAPDPLINAEGDEKAIPNDKKPALMSQAEYGPRTAVPRILRMLKKYDAKATFFVPGKTAEKYPEVIKAIDAAGHEIGNHGYSHMCPQLCYDEAFEREEYTKTSNIIEELTGKRPIGFRAPSFEFSVYTLGMLEDMGFIYDSSMMASDACYNLEVYGQKSNIVEVPCNWSIDDAPLWLMSNDVWGAPMPSPRAVLETWSDEFEFLYQEKENDNVFALTMHPQIIGRPARMMMLENLIKYIKGHGGVEFMTYEKCARQYLESK